MAMTATRRMCRSKVAILVSLLWLPYSVVQCIGCPSSASLFLSCRHAAAVGTSVDHAATASEHEDCHRAPGDGQDSQSRSCTDCCSTIANRSALTVKATVETAMPVVAVLPILHREPVFFAVDYRRSSSTSLVVPPRPLFLHFRSLLL